MLQWSIVEWTRNIMQKTILLILNCKQQLHASSTPTGRCLPMWPDPALSKTHIAALCSKDPYTKNQIDPFEHLASPQHTNVTYTHKIGWPCTLLQVHISRWGFQTNGHLLSKYRTVTSNSRLITHSVCLYIQHIIRFELTARYICVCAAVPGGMIARRWK